jgi:uncharacterized protein (DUF433 family)
MKLREARKLLKAGVSTKVIRKAVPALERMDPEWYLLPLEPFWPKHRQIVAHLRTGLAMLADGSGQILLAWPVLENTLLEIKQEGPLGELHEFRDAVAMDPSILAGNPVVVGTRLETDFIAGLAELGYGSEEVAALYRLPLHRVERVLSFEGRVAA